LLVTLWVVRAGEMLSSLPLFEKHDVIAIGWSELPSSPVGLTRPALAELMAATYPSSKPATLSNYTGQVWHFVNTMAPGDLVLVPLERSAAFRVAQVIGKAEARPELVGHCASREVEWLAESIPAETFDEDLRNAAGSIMGVSRPRASAAEMRVRQVLETGRDPGADTVTEDRSGAWVFQANPKRYDLLASLEAGPEETWAVNQHRHAIQPGDRVWFRITGASAGLYAVGTVTSLPREESGEFGDWLVDVDIHSRIEPPLLRADSDADQALAAVSALRGLMGTNLALTSQADARLEELTEDRLVPITGAQGDPAARALERKINLDVLRLTEQVERDLLEQLHELSHVEFEQLCAVYLQTLGCEDAAVVGAATAGSLGDGGIDVMGTLDQPGLPLVRLAVQAKRTSGGVGPNVVTQLRGSVGPGTQPMVITTGHFTKAAREEARRSDRPGVRLVDGLELAHVLATNAIGVKRTSLMLPRLDAMDLWARLTETT
jgi:predicted Mrr-cat superfamily restriction endonuclease